MKKKAGESMVIYLNPRNDSFQQAPNNQIYVDKSLLIDYTNQLIDTGDNKICVSFGKSTDANMFVAYYSKGCNSQKLFDSLKISQTHTYFKHLNQYNVIYLNMRNFLSMSSSVNDMITILNDEVIDSFVNSIRNSNRKETTRALLNSREL